MDDAYALGKSIKATLRDTATTHRAITAPSRSPRREIDYFFFFFAAGFLAAGFLAAGFFLAAAILVVLPFVNPNTKSRIGFDSVGTSPIW